MRVLLTSNRVNCSQNPVRVGKQTVALAVVVHVEQFAVSGRRRSTVNDNVPHHGTSGGKQSQGTASSLSSTSLIWTERSITELFPLGLASGQTPHRRLRPSNRKNEMALGESWGTSQL
jgi:hypothetical protein